MFLLKACVMTTAFAQSVSPAATDEYCPMVDHEFLVTIIGTNPSLSVTSGGPTIIAFPYQINTSSGTTTFKFKARFQDVNIKQEFTVSYKNSSNNDATYVIAFKKIRSLFYPNIDQTCAVITPNLPVIQAPNCQISTFNFSFTNIKYSTEFENPKSCFGNITTYEYLLPAGWQLNSTTSNGSTWIAGDNSETITSDATTGGAVQIRAINGNCSGPLLQKSQIKTVPINRGNPAFTISPITLPVTCTSTPTQTFTVSTSATLACTIAYTWELGAANGWLMGGSPAPETPFTTNDNFITLTVANGNVLPSSVKVTPVLNGVAQPQLTTLVTRAATNYGMIGGVSELCSGTSYPFSMYNVTSGSTFWWSYISKLPNYGASVVTVNTPTAGSTTITKIGDGVIDMHCTVSNTCGQVTNIVRADVKVGGYTSTPSITGYTLAYPPCFTPLCIPQAVANPISISSPFGTMVYTGVAYNNTENSLNITVPELQSGTWSLITGTVAYWTPTNGNFLKFYPSGGSSGSYVKFRLTKNGSCGSQYYDIDFHPVNYNPPYYRVAPNPVKNTLTVRLGDEQVSKGVAGKTFNDQQIQEITILDRNGRVLRKQSFGSGAKQAVLDVNTLAPGLYLLRIFDGKAFSTEKFIKE